MDLQRPLAVGLGASLELRHSALAQQLPSLFLLPNNVQIEAQLWAQCTCNSRGHS